jgi:hypothetical protein
MENQEYLTKIWTNLPANARKFFEKLEERDKQIFNANEKSYAYEEKIRFDETSYIGQWADEHKIKLEKTAPKLDKTVMADAFLKVKAIVADSKALD